MTHTYNDWPSHCVVFTCFYNNNNNNVAIYVEKDKVGMAMSCDKDMLNNMAVRRSRDLRLTFCQTWPKSFRKHCPLHITFRCARYLTEMS